MLFRVLSWKLRGSPKAPRVLCACSASLSRRNSQTSPVGLHLQWPCHSCSSRAVDTLILTVTCIGRHIPAPLFAAHRLLRRVNSFCLEEVHPINKIAASCCTTITADGASNLDTRAGAFRSPSTTVSPFRVRASSSERLYMQRRRPPGPVTLTQLVGRHLVHGHQLIA